MKYLAPGAAGPQRVDGTSSPNHHPSTTPRRGRAGRGCSAGVLSVAVRGSPGGASDGVALARGAGPARCRPVARDRRGARDRLLFGVEHLERRWPRGARVLSSARERDDLVRDVIEVLIRVCLSVRPPRGRNRACARRRRAPWERRPERCCGRTGSRWTSPRRRAGAGAHGGAARGRSTGLWRGQAVPGPAGAERTYGVPHEQLTESAVVAAGAARWWNAASRRGAVVAGVSKEASAPGWTRLARGLAAWSDSRAGQAAAAPAGFPRFKSRRRARLSCRFTTGAIRVERPVHVVLPRSAGSSCTSRPARWPGPPRPARIMCRHCVARRAALARRVHRGGRAAPGRPARWRRRVHRWSASTSGCAICSR